MLLLISFVIFLSLTDASRKHRMRSRNKQPSTDRKILSRDTGLDNCGQVFQGGQSVFPALDAYNCLANVPLNKTVASQFLQYYKDTIEFQSTLTYLKNPPSSYQQPPTDLLVGLDQIGRQLETGVFNSEYAFELAVLDLVYSAHDSHTYLYGGASDVFSFGSPFEISSVSVDGVQPPEVYIAYDLYASLYGGGYTASPIAFVNGQPVLEYYKSFSVVNSHGYVESHADWNDLMYSPAADIQGIIDDLAGASPFYPGDVFSVVFKNGTSLPDQTWLAVLNDFNNEGAVSSVSEFYDTFVAFQSDIESTQNAKHKRAAASTTAAQATAAATTTAAQASATSALPRYWLNTAYPEDPFVSQADLGGSGVLTGYLLDDEYSTAVLSLPSFDVYDDGITSFGPTIATFLEQSKAQGASKVVIDLQQNYGGRRLLAADTFKHFFPTIDPFGGSRERAHDTANLLGEIYTGFYNSHLSSFNDSDIEYFAQSAWVASDFVNAATGDEFASWSEYFGPHEDRLDLFTTIQRDNLSNPVFDENNLGDLIVYGYSNHSNKTSPQPYDAGDIVILTDGLCGSTCALFVEMMHHEAGVKTIAVGGLPQQLGPMQTVGGTRGARDYDADQLDLDIFGAENLDPTLASQLPDRNVDFFVDEASVNLQDQIRRGSGEEFPLQFAYEAAQCRIYYTLASVFNFTELWQHAARATWTDPTLCVKYSADHPSATGKDTDTVGPSAADKVSWAYPAASAATSSSSANDNPSYDLSELEGFEYSSSDIAGHVGATCDPKQPGYYCKQLSCVKAPYCSPNGIFNPAQYQCVRLSKDGCNHGQVVATGACLASGGKCNYCRSKTPITSQTCGTSTVKNEVPDDR